MSKLSPTNVMDGLRIDNGPMLLGRLEVNRELIDFSSASATKPDPTWEFIDTAGHFHAYDSDGGLPTLTTRTRTVYAYEDGDESYEVSGFYCRICDQAIVPNRLPDTGVKLIPGLVSWTVTVTTDQTIPQGLVSIRFGNWFGIARTFTDRVEYNLGGTPIITYRLEGQGPLGVRMATR